MQDNTRKQGKSFSRFIHRLMAGTLGRREDLYFLQAKGTKIFGRQAVIEAVFSSPSSLACDQSAPSDSLNLQVGLGVVVVIDTRSAY